jgi:D-alanine-D-alanine ligase
MIRSSASSLPPPAPFANGLRVAVIQGGPSAEAEVSRVSAEGVARALARAGHDVTRLECDRALPGNLERGGFEVVFPVVHGPFGEDGALQGVLELLALPYVGAGVLASATANDKVASKRVYRQLGLPVARDVVLSLADGPLDALAETIVAELGTSVVVKPPTQGSTIGMSILKDLAGPSDPRLAAAIEQALAMDAQILVEELVIGREVTCGVLDVHGESPTALPPLEIRPRAADVYDFQSKYAPGGSEHLCPAPIGEMATARVRALALAAHAGLGVRDLSRSDFVVPDDPGRIVILETNTMPGMTPTSLFPESAGVFGVGFEALCDRLVRGAQRRGVRLRSAPVAFPTGNA